MKPLRHFTWTEIRMQAHIIINKKELNLKAAWMFRVIGTKHGKWLESEAIVRWMRPGFENCATTAQASPKPVDFTSKTKSSSSIVSSSVLSKLIKGK